MENGAVPLFISPVANGGDFYALSNGVDRKTGAIVLRFDSQGTLRARYRCPLPTSVVPGTVTNPKGYLSPVSMVVTDSALLLISWSQKAVAAYGIK